MVGGGWWVVGGAFSGGGFNHSNHPQEFAYNYLFIQREACRMAKEVAVSIAVDIRVVTERGSERTR